MDQVIGAQCLAGSFCEARAISMHSQGLQPQIGFVVLCDMCLAPG